VNELNQSMRVLHVVTLMSQRGAFGGPATVCQQQCAELAARGDHVQIVAGYDGLGDTSSEHNVLLFRAWKMLPRRGFAATVSPRLMCWLWQNAKRYNVAHVHAGRDLVSLTTMAILRRRRVPYVAQTHGMVRSDTRWVVRAVDRLILRKLLAAAAACLVLTSEELAEVSAVSREAAKVRLVRNGVSAANIAPRRDKQRPPEVLYLARLHPRKRPEVFVEMAGRLLDAGIDADFTIVGPDDGSLTAVRRTIERLGCQRRVQYAGVVPPDRARARLSEAAVYVLPSVNEPFPMTVLEALSVGTPVVCTTSCGIAGELQVARAAVVTEPHVESIASGVAWLLEDPSRLQLLATRGRSFADTHYSIASVVDELLGIYRQAAMPQIG
jgi:glycosyltransferase involved in cell wall biosynthesis